jgi:preprotein translocase subunit YajC
MTLVELLPFAVIAAAFWLLIIRPASVRRKAQAALAASLAPGQRIMTTAGVFGTVVAVEAERVSLEIAPGVVIEMLAAAIAQVVPAAPEAVEAADQAPDAEIGGAATAGADTDEVAAAPSPEADRG